MNPKAENAEPEAPVNEGNGKAQLDSRFLVKVEGRDFVSFPGLLDLGHQKGLASIEVEPLQIPGPSNEHFAVCRATIISKTGETFTDIGDANPQNTSARVSKHLLRMASTRAIARALRSFTNIGMTCLEELDGDFSDNGNSRPKPQARKPASPAQVCATNSTQNTADATGNNANPNTRGGNGQSPPASDSQKRAIGAISRRLGMDETQINDMTMEMFSRNLDHLTVPEASNLITRLNSTHAAAA